MRRTPRQRAYSIIELLAAIGVLAILMNVAAVTYYHGQRQTVGLAQCAGDIVRAVSAGERWRENVRSATAMPTLKDGVFTIPQKNGTLQYRFGDGLVERKKGGKWLPLLKDVKVSRMIIDRGKHVTSWRWEIELRARSRSARVHPLFTFQAVPGKAG